MQPIEADKSSGGGSGSGSSSGSGFLAEIQRGKQLRPHQTRAIGPRKHEAAPTVFSVLIRALETRRIILEGKQDLSMPQESPTAPATTHTPAPAEAEREWDE